MKDFRKVLKEIDFELNKLLLFDVFLTTMIVLLVFYLALALLGLPRVYCLFALTYFVIAAAMKMRERKTLDVELKFGFLKEKLRTAEDNINLRNPVVEELQHEIVSDLKKVDEGAFISGKKTYIKSAIVVLLCFLVIFIAPMAAPEFNFINKEPNETTEIGEKAMGAGTFLKKEATGGLTPSPDNIYGEESVAQLGKRELKVTIQPAGYELNVRDISDIEEIEFVEDFPEEIEATSAQMYEEKIPKEHAELVKNYFKALAEG